MIEESGAQRCSPRGHDSLQTQSNWTYHQPANDTTSRGPQSSEDSLRRITLPDTLLRIAIGSFTANIQAVLHLPQVDGKAVMLLLKRRPTDLMTGLKNTVPIGYSMADAFIKTILLAANTNMRFPAHRLWVTMRLEYGQSIPKNLACLRTHLLNRHASVKIQP